MNKPMPPLSIQPKDKSPYPSIHRRFDGDIDQDVPLYVHMQRAIETYLANLNGEPPTQMYELFLHQMEKPLLEAVLRHTRGNQSKTAQMLGLNRGTLRTKLKTHNLL